METKTNRSKTIPASIKREVEPLASTSYSIERASQEEVVLRNGKSLELWCRVEVPHKGYALLIDGHEYEFDSKVKE